MRSDYLPRLSARANRARHRWSDRGGNIYAHGFCSLKCYRMAECGLTEKSDTPACEDECTDDAVDALPSDPCWAEWIESRRCAVLNASCEGVDEEVVAGESEASCEGREQDLMACEM